MVKNGYSNISKLLLFMDGRNMAPPPLPVLPADAFSELPENVIKSFIFETVLKTF